MSEVNPVKGMATNLARGHTLPKCRDHFPQPGGRPSKCGFVERPTKVRWVLTPLRPPNTAISEALPGTG